MLAHSTSGSRVGGPVLQSSTAPGFGRPRRFHAKRGWPKPKAQAAPLRIQYGRSRGGGPLRPLTPGPSCPQYLFQTLDFLGKTPCKSAVKHCAWGPDQPPPLPPDFFFKIIQFSGNFNGKTILSNFWAQGPPPLGSKLRWAPPDQNPGSAPA